MLFRDTVNMLERNCRSVLAHLCLFFHKRCRFVLCLFLFFFGMMSTSPWFLYHFNCHSFLLEVHDIFEWSALSLLMTMLQFIHQVSRPCFLAVIDHCSFILEVLEEWRGKSSTFPFGQQSAVTHCRGSLELFISNTCFITNKNRLLWKEMGNPYQHDTDSLQSFSFPCCA